jgi:DNA-binding protein H-NS
MEYESAHKNESEVINVTETYQALKGQLTELTQRLEVRRRMEAGDVVREIRRLIVEYELTPRDIFGNEYSGLKHVPREAKYRNPETGQTWSGRGRPPRWFDHEHAELFLIERMAKKSTNSH